MVETARGVKWLPSHGFLAMVVILVVASGGFIAAAAQGMWTAPGSAGMTPGGFVLIWSAMMTAVMLPSVAPFGRLYLRTLDTHWFLRASAFIAGYLAVWCVTGVAAYALAWLVDHIVIMRGPAPRFFAAAIFCVVAAFSFTDMKSRMLRKCRNPIGLLIQYSGRDGWARDLRAGLDHGATCLACCWALMLLMAVFGMMNVAAMVVIAIVIALEKLWAHGLGFSRLVGVVNLVLAVLVLAVPQVAVAFHNSASMMSQ